MLSLRKTLFLITLLVVKNSYSQNNSYDISDSLLVVTISSKGAILYNVDSIEKCKFEANRFIENETALILLEKKKCINNSVFKKDSITLFKVSFNGRLYYIKEDDLVINNNQKRFWEDSLKDSKVINLANRMHGQIKTLYDKLLKLKIDNIKQAGIGFHDFRIVDESEYTNGTGLYFTLTNFSKKRIKYISISIIGINRVGDPVKDIYGGTVKTIKVVGPCDPFNSYKFEYEYLWHTDLVDSFKIKSIQIDFFDGTKKTITNTRNLIIQDDETELLQTLLSN